MSEEEELNARIKIIQSIIADTGLSFALGQMSQYF